ncbi:MAG: hypothetical protein NVS1B13_08020 [Flavisolibacter sp.]
MNIFFDILKKHKAVPFNSTNSEAAFYKIAMDFIKERLSPIREEIEKEEKEAEARKLSCFTEMIVEVPPSLAFRNYSSALRAKMNDCFSEEDGEYLTLLMYQRLSESQKNK